MIKKYISLNNRDDVDVTYLLGNTSEIAEKWKELVNDEEHDYIPLFAEEPIFSERKEMYAIAIDNDRFITVVNSDIFLKMILVGEVEALPA
jgi:hypothetical protein